MLTVTGLGDETGQCPYGVSMDGMDYTQLSRLQNFIEIGRAHV